MALTGEMRTKSAVPDKNLRVVREGHVASDKVKKDLKLCRDGIL